MRILLGVLLLLADAGADEGVDPCVDIERDIATLKNLADRSDGDERAGYLRDIEREQKKLAPCRAKEAADKVIANRKAQIEAEARKRVETTKAADEAEIDRLSEDRKILQLAMSGALCSLKPRRVDVLKQIAEKKKYARLSGVVDLEELNDLSVELQNIDAEAKRWSGGLKRQKMAAMPCSADRVKRTAACIEGECAEDVRLIGEIARRERQRMGFQ